MPGLNIFWFYLLRLPLRLSKEFWAKPQIPILQLNIFVNVFVLIWELHDYSLNIHCRFVVIFSAQPSAREMVHACAVWIVCSIKAYFQLKACVILTKNRLGWSDVTELRAASVSSYVIYKYRHYTP